MANYNEVPESFFDELDRSLNTYKDYTNQMVVKCDAHIGEQKHKIKNIVKSYRDKSKNLPEKYHGCTETESEDDSETDEEAFFNVPETEKEL